MKEIRFAVHPEDFRHYTTEQIRDRFLISDLMTDDQVTLTYTMYDRMAVLGVKPVKSALSLPAFEVHTKSAFFLERRELGIINTGGSGHVSADGVQFELKNKECLYIGMGTKEVTFSSLDSRNPAEFYINSCPTHTTYPTQKTSLADANQVNLGSKENCNERTIYQFIHEKGIQSCQLVMGFTSLHTGSIWNTFPPHTHLRRMEVYYYFDLPSDQLVMHFMGDPKETRHLAISNKQGVISPEWSIHSGAGSSNYSFVWGMAGENKTFTDMDGQPLNSLR